MRPTARLRLLNEIRADARIVGALDEAGLINEATLNAFRAKRRKAEVYVDKEDIVEVTFEGLEQGRATARRGRTGGP